MKFIFFILFFIVLLFNQGYAQNDDSEKLLMCMYLSRSAERQGQGNFKVAYIDERLCTHLIYAYVGIADNGEVRSYNEPLDYSENNGQDNLRKFNAKKHYSPKLRTLIGVGGWEPSEVSKRYSGIFRSDDFQKNFVSSILNFINKYNFNGLALHWAFPGINGGDPVQDKKTYSQLLQKLSKEFRIRNLILTVVCHGLGGQIEDSYIVPEVARYADYIYVTSYDLYGEWSGYIGMSSGLYLNAKEKNKDLSADSVVQNWIKRGAPKNKIVMGIPLQVRTFTLKDVGKTEPLSLSSGGGRKSAHIQHSGLMAYTELCQQFAEDPWEQRWEETQKGPYAFYEDQWVTWENERSLEIKSKYIKENELAGAVVVFVEDDDFRGVCGEKFPRLKLLNQFLRAIKPKDDTEENEYILNVSVFRKNKNDNSVQCIYHFSENLEL